MSNIVHTFNSFIAENEMPQEDWNVHDEMTNLGMIDEPAKESFSIINRRGESVLDDLSEEFVDFVFELKRMVDLYKSNRFTSAEQLKNKLSEQMDDLMQS